MNINRIIFAPLALAAFLPSTAPAQGLQFYSLTPCRALDTRLGTPNPLQVSVIRAVTIKGVCGVPATARAVSLNLTVTQATFDGFVTLWAFGGAYPATSNINFTAADPALANAAVIPLAAGTPDLNAVYGNNNIPSQTTHLVLDVTGYYQ